MDSGRNRIYRISRCSHFEHFGYRSSDFLVGAINMPLSATVDFVISRQVFKVHICLEDLINVYWMYALTSCALYHLIFIAWERYQGIRNCYEHKVKMTRSRLKKLAITAWFLATLTPIPSIALKAPGIYYDIICYIAEFFALFVSNRLFLHHGVS